MMFGSLNSPNVNHNALFLLTQSVVKLSEDNSDLKPRIKFIKDNSTEDINIPISILSEWYQRHKTKKMNCFLTYDDEAYSLGRVTIALGDVISELIMIMSEVIERNEIQIDPFDLSRYKTA